MLNWYQGKIWYERALFYGQKGDLINAKRAYAIARRYDPDLPLLPKFHNHATLRKLERLSLTAAFLFFCWLLYLLFFGSAAVISNDFDWIRTGSSGSIIQPDPSADESLRETPALAEESPLSCPSRNIDTQQEFARQSSNPVIVNSRTGGQGFETLEPYILLRNALYCYARDQGHFPSHLDDLVKTRYLEKIPAEPETGNSQVYDSFTGEGGWIYLCPAIYVPSELVRQVEMALYINRRGTPLIPFIPRSVFINPQTSFLTLQEGDYPLKSWPVAIGADNTPTPVGSYLIIEKHVLANGSTNPFGSRWMKLGEQYPDRSEGKVTSTNMDNLASRGIGIHGTNTPSSIGNSVTNGCIRMNNADIEELYQLIPNGISIQVGR